MGSIANLINHSGFGRTKLVTSVYSVHGSGQETQKQYGVKAMGNFSILRLNPGVVVNHAKGRPNNIKEWKLFLIFFCNGERRVSVGAVGGRFVCLHAGWITVLLLLRRCSCHGDLDFGCARRYFYLQKGFPDINTDARVN
jgi:hypothetical protein